MKRNFEKWFGTFTDTIASYDYFVDFNKVYHNLKKIKVKLNILNSLIGSKKIKQDFKSILTEYPNVIECIPILIAIRKKEIKIRDDEEIIVYSFKKKTDNIDKYAYFMEKIGLFDLLSNHIINNLYDYVTGIEI